MKDKPLSFIVDDEPKNTELLEAYLLRCLIKVKDYYELMTLTRKSLDARLGDDEKSSFAEHDLSADHDR